MASEEPYKTQLNNWNRVFPVLSLDEYAKMMFDEGLKDLNISMKVYPIITDNTEKLFQFISGSALIPYLEKLDAMQQEIFSLEYKRRIAENFEYIPTIYAFKRLFLYGRKQ